MIKDAPRAARIITAWRLVCLSILAISGAVYLPAMSGLAIWDDHALIGGPGIGGGKSLSACFTEPFLLHYFRPLVSVTFFVEHRLFGSGPFFYHQTNLLIHVLTTLVCLALFRAAFQSRTIAAAGALAFALQPAQVSTVAWIGGRTDSLCTLWVALFAWGLVRSAQTYRSRRLSWCALSTLSFGLALLTKEQALGLLPLVPFAFRCFANASKGRAWRDGIRWSVPYLITGAAFVAAWFLYYPSPFRPVMHSVPEQAALAGRSMIYYAALLAAPTPTTMHLLSVGSLECWGIWSAAAGFAALGGVVFLGIRSMRGNPACAWFCAYVLMAILPVCNLVPLPSLVVAPYRAGVCGMGAAALLGSLMAWGYRRLIVARGTALVHRQPTERGFSPAKAINGSEAVMGQFRIVQSPPKAAMIALGLGQALAAALFLAWCGCLSAWGATRWQDERVIFSTIVRYDPDSIVARFNLTTALLKQHRTQPALRELNALMTRLFGSNAWMRQEPALMALKRYPEIMDRIRENQGNAIRPESWLAALYAQRGFAELNSRNRAAAARSFAIGRAIDRANDDVNLGLAQMEYDRGRYVKAAGYLRVVLAARPRRAEAHMLLGHALAAQGHWREAHTQLEAWAEIQPWSGQAQMELAQAKCRLGDYSGARASLQYALGHSICDTREVRARLRDLHGRAKQFLN